MGGIESLIDLRVGVLGCQFRRVFSIPRGGGTHDCVIVILVLLDILLRWAHMIIKPIDPR